MTRPLFSISPVEEAVRGPKVREKPYYQKHPPKIDWEWMFVVGLYFGGLTAAWLAGDVVWQWVPEIGAWLSASVLILAEEIINAKPGFIQIGKHLVEYGIKPLFFSALLAGWLMAISARHKKTGKKKK